MMPKTMPRLHAVPERIGLNFAPARTTLMNRADGGFVLTSPVKLNAYASNICEFLHHWANAKPEQTFIAERAKNAPGAS